MVKLTQPAGLHLVEQRRAEEVDAQAVVGFPGDVELALDHPVEDLCGAIHVGGEIVVLEREPLDPVGLDQVLHLVEHVLGTSRAIALAPGDVLAAVCALERASSRRGHLGEPQTILAVESQSLGLADLEVDVLIDEVSRGERNVIHVLNVAAARLDDDLSALAIAEPADALQTAAGVHRPKQRPRRFLALADDAVVDGRIANQPLVERGNMRASAEHDDVGVDFLGDSGDDQHSPFERGEQARETDRLRPGILNALADLILGEAVDEAVLADVQQRVVAFAGAIDHRDLVAVTLEYGADVTQAERKESRLSRLEPREDHRGEDQLNPPHRAVSAVREIRFRRLRRRGAAGGRHW